MLRAIERTGRASHVKLEFWQALSETATLSVRRRTCFRAQRVIVRAVLSRLDTNLCKGFGRALRAGKTALFTYVQ